MSTHNLVTSAEEESMGCGLSALFAAFFAILAVKRFDRKVREGRTKIAQPVSILQTVIVEFHRGRTAFISASRVRDFPFSSTWLL